MPEAPDQGIFDNLIPEVEPPKTKVWIGYNKETGHAERRVVSRKPTLDPTLDWRQLTHEENNLCQEAPKRFKFNGPTLSELTEIKIIGGGAKPVVGQDTASIRIEGLPDGEVARILVNDVEYFLSSDTEADNGMLLINPTNPGRIDIRLDDPRWYCKKPHVSIIAIGGQ